MKSLNHERLLPFYFGAVEEAERLEVERLLLTDVELLLNYLDLKRQIESAAEIPKGPSPRLWQRLKRPVLARPRLLAFTVGLALVASFVLVTMMFFKPALNPRARTMPDKILFDSSSELSATSNVL